MEKQLRKGDLGEALFREWAERNLNSILRDKDWILEQQGFARAGIKFKPHTPLSEFSRFWIQICN